MNEKGAGVVIAVRGIYDGKQRLDRGKKSTKRIEYGIDVGQ